MSRPSLAHKVALSSSLNVLQQIVAVVGAIFVARVVGPDVLGVLAYAAAFAGMFTSLSDLGFGTAHIKRVSEGRDLAQGMGMAWLAKAASLVLMTLVILLAFWAGGSATFHEPEQQTVFYLSVAMLIVTQLAMVPVTTLSAFQDIPRKDLPPTLLQFGNSLLRVGLAVLGAGAVGLVAADLTTAVLLLLVYVWILHRLPVAWPSRAVFRSYAVFGAPMFVISLLLTVGDRLDRVLLQSFAGSAAVGQYAAGLRFGSVLQFLSLAVAGVVFPSMSRAFAEGQPEEAFRLCERAVRRLALVLFPCLLLVAAVARPLAVSLLGERFADTGPVIAFGTLAMIFQAFTQPYRQLLGGADKTRAMVVGHVLLFGVQAGLLYAFLGLPGLLVPGVEQAAPAAAALAVAAASLVGAGVWRAIATLVLRAHLDRRIGVHVVAALALFGAIYAVTAGFSRSLPVSLFVGGLAVVAHLGVLWVTGELRRPEVDFLVDLVAPVGQLVHVRLGRGHQPA